MPNVTLTLPPDVARLLVLDLAKRYARLAIKSRLPVRQTVNAPWFAGWSNNGQSESAIHREWLKEVTAMQARYRSALAINMPDSTALPPVPPVPWRTYQGPPAKAVAYASATTEAAADVYAQTVCGLLGI